MSALSQKKVLVIGAGGLGCPVSLALAKGGVGAITFVDPDVVDVTNLHRQPWHRTSDVGRLKAESAAESLRAAFPQVTTRALPVRVTHENAETLFLEHDLVIDATDGVKTKFLLSDAAVLTGVPLIYGGVLRMSGQVMAITRDGPCLRCLFEAPPPPDAVPTCAQAGVLGAMAGFIGALQALLARDVLLGKRVPPLLRSFDGATLRMREVKVDKQRDCATCAEPRAVKLQPAEELACAI